MVLSFPDKSCSVNSDHFKKWTVCACSEITCGGILISKCVQRNFNHYGKVSTGQVVHLRLLRNLILPSSHKKEMCA